MTRSARILPGCFASSDSPSPPPLGRRARGARLVAAAGFLAVACVVNHLQLPGGVATEAAAGLGLAWFSLSHAVAAGSGYQGCPELGAIASLFRRRPVVTNCTAWRRIDSTIRA